MCRKVQQAGSCQSEAFNQTVWMAAVLIQTSAAKPSFKAHFTGYFRDYILKKKVCVCVYYKDIDIDNIIQTCQTLFIFMTDKKTTNFVLIDFLFLFTPNKTKMCKSAGHTSAAHTYD